MESGAIGLLDSPVGGELKLYTLLMVGVCEPPGCGWPCTGAWCGGAYTEAGGFGMRTGPAG